VLLGLTFIWMLFGGLAVVTSMMRGAHS